MLLLVTIQYLMVRPCGVDDTIDLSPELQSNQERISQCWEVLLGEKSHQLAVTYASSDSQ